jgi:hypothetical protein
MEKEAPVNAAAPKPVLKKSRLFIVYQFEVLPG